MRYAAAPLAVLVMGVIAFVLVSAAGRDPWSTFNVLLVEPFASAYGVGELLLKATPLMLCATGLAVGYRANVWNIGAEGQFIVGAICGGGRGLVPRTGARAGRVPVDGDRRRARGHGMGGHSRGYCARAFAPARSS